MCIHVSTSTYNYSQVCTDNYIKVLQVLSVKRPQSYIRVKVNQNPNGLLDATVDMNQAKKGNGFGHQNSEEEKNQTFSSTRKLANRSFLPFPWLCYSTAKGPWFLLQQQVDITLEKIFFSKRPKICGKAHKRPPFLRLRELQCT